MKARVISTKNRATLTDFTLLISRMEEDILEGRNQAACRKTLGRDGVWKSLDTENQLKWARLAQMAGEVETALEVFTHINRGSPKLRKAWFDRFELLLLLDRKKEMVQALAASKGILGEKERSEWVTLSKNQKGAALEEDVGAALTPFEKLRHRQDLLEHYLKLFSGKEDCFARQWVDKQEGKQGYVPVRRPLEVQDLEEHLSGRKTYGIYLMKSDATVKLAVIDADLVKQFRKGKLKGEDRGLIRREHHYLVSRIKELGGEMGIRPLLEFSGGKGFHFWFFFETPVAAGEAKMHLEGIKGALKDDLSAFNLEVFPKQVKLSGKGFGNLVKLPLGVHRLTGKRSYFPECEQRSVESQLDFLSNIKSVSLRQITPIMKEGSAEKLVVHPRWQRWANDYPELFKLESLCPPIAQIIATCRHGKNITLREEKIIFQSIGFLPRAKSLLHYLIGLLPDYNPHLVDFRLSRLRGSPLGCKRIHSLLSFTGDICPFDEKAPYVHPLLHLGQWNGTVPTKAEKVENLSSALERLKLAVSQVERFLA